MDTATTRFTYRSWIDGLRAIAVLMVIFNHYFGLLPAGYLGVDLFFVISGFLVGGIIYEQVKEKQFSLSFFYINRIHRIIPAQLFMMLLVLIALFVLHYPAELIEQYCKEAFYAALSISNINYWTSAGYFDLGSVRKFLLHIWSLAVEEQFYLLFPLVMLLIAKCKKWLQWIFLLLLIFCSLGIHFLAYTPYAKFYLLPFRFWEFAAGFLVYYASKHTWPPKNIFPVFTWIAVLLLIILQWNPLHYEAEQLIIITTILFVIVFYCLEKHENKFIKTILSVAPLRYIGKISYSLYLIHWPVMVIMRLKYAVRQPSLLNFFIYAAIIFSLSLVSYYFVESKFRIHGSRKSSPKFIVSALLIAFISIGGALFIYFEKPYTLQNTTPFTTEKFALENCGQLVVESGKKNDHFPTVVFWGDSHAGMMTFDQQTYAGYNLYKVYSTGCPPFFNTVVSTECNCNDQHKIEQAWKIIRAIKPDYIVLAARYSIYINGMYINNALRKANHFIALPGNENDTSFAQRQEAFTLGMQSTLDSIKSIGAKAIICRQVPDFSNFHNPEALMLGGVFSVRESSLLKYLHEGDAIIDSLTKTKQAVLFDPRPYITGGRGFLLYDEKSNRLFYNDDSHLSPTGAMRITTPLKQLLK